MDLLKLGELNKNFFLKKSKLKKRPLNVQFYGIPIQIEI